MTNKHFSPNAVPVDLDVEFPRQPDTVFSVLNMVVIATLLAANVFFARFWGPVSSYLFTVLSLGFLSHAALLVWLQTHKRSLTVSDLKKLTWISISLTSLLTIAVSTTNRYDSPYYILMMIPVLQAAFRFSLPATIAVILVADLLNFFWIWQYFRLGARVEFDEYLEAGAISLLYTLTGLVVWLLVNRLRYKELTLANKLEELDRTRHLLSEEEKLAAIGRLSSAISHEIRNPVAVISSSLQMARAANLDASQRDEMFQIAANEASRLEQLTSEFLNYALPHPPLKSQALVSEILGYLASSCRAYGTSKGLKLEVSAPEELMADTDLRQIQQALLNLVRNSIDASSQGQTVFIRGRSTDSGDILLEVENSGPPIPEESLPRLFEPFYTTKPAGSGLGLAISRNICRAHGGDLKLTQNRTGRVCFTIQLPRNSAEPIREETKWVAS
jgi:signal transduction histidine kinase